MGNPFHKSRPEVCGAPCFRSETSGTTRRYPDAKETKPKGMDDRKSELFIVPMNAGNHLKGLAGGKGEPNHGTEGGKDE